jgi:hypothetical protein
VAFFLAVLAHAAATLAVEETAWIRVNVIGYLPDDPKIAILSSDKEQTGRFRVGDFSADLPRDEGPWGPFAHNYRLDFSALKKPGQYSVTCNYVESPKFKIGDDAYAEVVPKLRYFMRAQRCGDNPITGKKCHQSDAIDTETTLRRDLTGGWHDAADRIKHMITTSYCVAALKLAGEDEEARYGAEMIKKIHPEPEKLYVQVADDRDHGLPHTTWENDKTDYGWGPGGPRPAWPATGKPEGPKYQNRSSGLASLAGRCAAAMALNGDVKAAESLYHLAVDKPGCAMSVPVKAPYYYGEASFYDDLEWGAIELYNLTHKPELIGEAMAAAEKAGASDWMGKDRHGHYECFPYVNLGHWRLYPHVAKDNQEKLAGFYKQGLDWVRTRAEKNPYRLGTPLVWCSTNDVIAFATQAALYEQMTGDKQYRALAAEARDWIFGRNPWGMSFVIGVPEGKLSSSDPHHLMHLIAKELPVGGLVDGPVYKDINDGLKFGDFGKDRLARFQSDVAVYHDAFEDFSTNEPIIDGTVSLMLLLKVWK